MVENSQETVEKAAQMLEKKVTQIWALPQVISEMSESFKNKYHKLVNPVTLLMRPEWLDE